eukprot:UN08594
MDVNQSPPEVIPMRKSFDAKTGAPQAPLHLHLQVEEKGNKENKEKSTEAPPSLETIFGRKVEDNCNDMDKNESSSEDSLLQRQMDFGSTPDGPDGVKDYVGSATDKLNKPESQFVLTV